MSFAALPVAAQGTGTIQGTVLDTASMSPLAVAQVSVRGTTLGARTGDDGRFTIIGVPAGNHTLRVTRIGFSPVTRDVTVSTGSTTTVSFTLSAAATALEGVVVTALGIEREERSLSTSVQMVSGEDLTNAPDPNLVASLS